MDEIRSAIVPPLKVLIVDDDPGVLLMLERCLTDAGCVVRRAATAESGIALARNEPMDVILTDLCLPGMNGFDAIGALRGERGTPVLVMTGHNDSEFQKDAICFGAAGLIEKPVELAKLIDSVRRAAGRL
jgi:DNA-binding NtrC family response regulator